MKDKGCDAAINTGIKPVFGNQLVNYENTLMLFATPGTAMSNKMTNTRLSSYTLLVKTSLSLDHRKSGILQIPHHTELNSI